MKQAIKIINVFTVTYTILLMISCSQENKFTIEGEIKNGEQNKIYLSKLELLGDQIIDSAKISNKGSFSFSLSPLTEPTFFKLSLSPNRFITLIGDSTENISIEADYEAFASSYRVEGSKASQKVRILNRNIRSLRSEIDEISDYYDNLSEEQQQEELENISEKLTTIIEDYKQSVGEFVMNNPKCFSSYYALFLTLHDGTPVMNVMDNSDQVYFATIATSLDILYPESPRVEQLYNMVLEVKAQERRADQLMELMETSERSIPEIVQKNPAGEEIALSSLEGNVVLLSFTASWDEQSRIENRNLKPLYQRYNSQGFEVYQVSLDRSRVLWENMIQTDELPWISVSDLQYTNNYAARVYNIQQIPANYLISRDGELVGRNLFGDRLEERIVEEL
ncbi:TlpA disulfide reductase family protein [Marinilabiliaceae bacterium ANBcel2]|nr:TlpA disulfide reductase family protein [Marinilabiliaceae bacterium ANBcel2]